MMGRFLVLFGVFLAVLALPAAWAADPWEFGSTSERQSAEKRYRSYWNEDYKVAMELLRAGAERADEAIVRLKLAISKKPQSDPEGLDPIAREPLAYFPYYYLAVAYDLKGSHEFALRCMDRESKKISGSRLGKDFAALRESLQVRATAGELLGHADQVVGWEKGQAEVVLSREGRARISDIRRLREALAKAAGADARRAFGELRGGLKEFLAGEVRAGSERLAHLGIAQGCASFPDDGGSRALGRALDAVVSCNRAVTQALRRSGQKECESLAALRDEARRLEEELRQWTEREGGASTPRAAFPELPPSCIEWDGAPAVKVHEAFAALEVEKAGARQALTKGRDDLGARVSAKRGQWAEKVDAAVALLPELPADCAQGLQLAQLPARMKEVRGKLSQWKGGASGVPPREAMNPSEFVEAERKRFLDQVEVAVQRMQQNSACPGIDVASLSALPAAVASFRSDPQRGVAGLCGAARAAAAEIQTCWSKNLPFVRERVAAEVAILEAAQRSRASAAGLLEAPGGPACLDEKARSLRAVRTASAATAAEWVPRAVADLGEAHECLRAFHAAVERFHTRLLDEIRRTREIVESTGVAPSDAEGSGQRGESSLASRVRRLGEDLGDAGARLEKVSPLYARPVSECSQPGEIVRGAGLEQNLSGEAWGLLAAAKDGEGALDAGACLALADAAVLPTLGAVSTKLAGWEPFVRALGPFAALSGAFSRFSRGDLDGAILALREAQAAKRIPARGSQAALAHAALSYFLHSKSAALAAQGADADVAGSLEQDAAREAKLAKDADEGFAPPAALFRSEGFRRKFRTYARAD